MRSRTWPVESPDSLVRTLTVEHQRRVRAKGWLEVLRRHRASVGAPGHPELGIHDILRSTHRVSPHHSWVDAGWASTCVIGPVGRSVLELVANVRYRGVMQRGPQVVDEDAAQFIPDGRAVRQRRYELNDSLNLSREVSASPRLPRLSSTRVTPSKGLWGRVPRHQAGYTHTRYLRSSITPPARKVW